jgi:hypothetical protein
MKESPYCEEAAIVGGECFNCGWYDSKITSIALKTPLEIYRERHRSMIYTEVTTAIERMQTMVDALLNHCDKEGGECSVCSAIVCPHKDILHFHHDGCPSCSANRLG